MNGHDDVKLPPPAHDLVEGDEYKKREEDFVKTFFEDRPLPPRPVGDPDITFPEEKPAEQPAGETSPEPEKKDEEKKDEPKPEEKKADDTDALLGEEGKKTETPDPAKPADKPAEQPAAIDPDDIADRVVERLKPREQKAAPAPDPLATFNEEDKEELRVLQALNKNPKYAGRDLVKETTEFWKREEEYAAVWRRNNPGKRFNKDDEEHSDFYETSTPDIADKDIENAHIALRVEEAAERKAEEKVKERLAPIEQKLKETERETLEQKVKPAIADAVNQAIATLATEAVPDFKEVVKDGRLTREALDVMREKDPAAVKAINAEARTLRVTIEECERMAQMPDHFRFEEGKRVQVEGVVIRPHAEIMDTAHEIEDSIMRGPKEGRLRDGRQFIPTALFTAKMEEAHKAGNQALIDRLLNNFWIIGTEDIKQALVRKSAEKVKGILEIANARGGAPGNKSTEKDGKSQSSPAQNPPAKKAPVSAPSTASASDITDTRIPKAPAAQTQEKIIEKAFFG